MGWDSGGPPPEFFIKIYVSENAFQAILKPIFPYSITSILIKVRHSNTLFFAINSAFPCHPLDAFGKVMLFYCGTTLAYSFWSAFVDSEEQFRLSSIRQCDARARA